MVGINKLIVLLITMSATLFSADYNIEYKRLSVSERQLIFNVLEHSIDSVEFNGSKFSKIVFGGGVWTNKKGYAELPILNSTVQIDDNFDVVLIERSAEFIEIELKYPLLPSRGTIFRDQDLSSIPYETDPASFGDKWYPETISECTEPFIFRDVRGVNVYVYPMRYNPERQILRVYKYINVVLRDESGTSTNPLKRRTDKVDRAMNGIYRSLFINFNESKYYNQVADKGDILVICTPRDSEAIQPYIDWKRQRGFTVNILEVSAGTNVKELIQNAYDSNPDILYVQLVGDWADIQSDIGTDQSAPMDPMLGCVTGRDIYPELIIGRFSAGSAHEVAVQVDKTINYEKYPEENGLWYEKGLGIGSPEGEGIGDDGEIDYEHIDVIKEYKLLPFTYDNIYDAYGNPSSSTVAGYINAGLSIINYCGHGSNTSWGTSGYSNTNIYNSTNGSRLPFIFSVACVNGAFHSGTCFAEAWLRKSGGGAVATLMSSINQPWVPPMRGQDYMNDILIGGYDYTLNPGSGTITTRADGRTTFGSISVSGCVLMLAEQYNDTSTKNTIQTWTIFGDASLQVRTSAPVQVEITNETLFVENYSTRITFGGTPLEGAVVTLYKDGTSYSQITDELGEVSVAHPFTDGDVLITVTGFNLFTKQILVPVETPDGPYLKVKDYSFSSSEFAGISSIMLGIGNIGTSVTEGFSLKISCGSEYVNLINREWSSDSIILSPGTDYSAEDVFSFEISPAVPDRERIELLIELTDDSGNIFLSKIYFTASAPSLAIFHTPQNETARQGESFTVSFDLKNEGNADIDDYIVSLSQLSGYEIEISDQVLKNGLEAGSLDTLSFTCSFGEDIPNSSLAVFELLVESSKGYKKAYGFSVVVGMTDDFETGGFTANPWSFSGTRQWEVKSGEAYEGNYSAWSGNVYHGETSSISLVLDYIEDGTLSFYRKVSSELAYDRLTFFIDGSLKKTWSGELSWTKFTYSVNAGQHEFKWTFSRDNSMDGGHNCAWIDNILASGIKTSGVECESGAVPDNFVLYQNYPNPFNPLTIIQYSLDGPAFVDLSVYNITGQKVADLVKEYRQQGLHSAAFDASKLNSGVYYYTLNAGNEKITKKMLLVK